ncbi:MAG: division/cell wall cluster transcriptional repressor MraZ [Bacteroidia bacterium]
MHSITKNIFTNNVNNPIFINKSGKMWFIVVKCGKKTHIFGKLFKISMKNLIGEYDCKVDAKGRFMFPVDLKKQLDDNFEKGFVINRNLHQKCLVLYPINEWEKLNAKLGKLNRLIKANDVFVRRFTGGATSLQADGTGRILLPKPLTNYAEIQSEIKVLGSNKLIEIWDKNNYNEFLNQEVDIETLANEVLGGLNFNDDE